MQAGLGMPPAEILEYIRSVVDIVIQLKRADKGRRYVSEVYFKSPQALQTKSAVGHGILMIFVFTTVSPEVVYSSVNFISAILLVFAPNFFMNFVRG